MTNVPIIDWLISRQMNNLFTALCAVSSPLIIIHYTRISYWSTLYSDLFIKHHIPVEYTILFWNKCACTRQVAYLLYGFTERSNTIIYVNWSLKLNFYTITSSH